MPQVYGLTASSKPSPKANASQAQPETDPFGALHTRQELYAYLDHGSYFRACNTTPGTGIATGLQTSFSATANITAMMVNGSTTQVVIPHYIRMTNQTAATTTMTSAQLAIIIDTANRYSSGGTDLLANVFCANTAFGPTSALSKLVVGSITATAAGGGTRLVSRAGIKTQATPCFAVGDEVLIVFGSMGMEITGALAGSTASRLIVAAGPVLLGAQNASMNVHLWTPANTVSPNFEFEFAWWER